MPTNISAVAESVDPQDEGTPDNWVPRDPRLIRLTGKHPFNCEPPPNLAYEQGFITPLALHYVRNHGACPHLNWHDHRLTINGLVQKPMTLTMDQISEAFPQMVRCIPITVTCSGNRRKEQNMLKKTIGFNWGPCGTSTCYWKGLRLSSLLEYCGVEKDKAGHVCALGSDDLPKGKYGTSIPISMALDPLADVLVAFEVNGTHIPPDHGYPLRLIVPGWIGGRMVKWLTQLTVSETSSDNFYHLFDNRVFPPHVDESMINSEDWKDKPEYLFNELNINSVPVYPAHDEFIPFNKQSCKICGYAYSGGGKKVTRVEVSLDNCSTWNLCQSRWPEEEVSDAPRVNSRHWCWMFWEYTADMLDLLQAVSEEIQVRAWDQSNNTQPEKPTWNLMGMGHNAVYRIHMHPERRQGIFGIRFEHPVLAGTLKGGWLERQHAPAAPALPPLATAPEKKYTWEEVQKHRSPESVWIVVQGKVYDPTRFLKDHPGGAGSILMNGGQDATDDFLAIHSPKAQAMLASYLIGSIAETTETEEGVPPDVALIPNQWRSFQLVKKDYETRNVVRLRFAFHSPEKHLGMPVGYHLFVKANVKGEVVIRPYTPTSSNDDPGFFELVVKIYFANEVPKFPEGGKMSQHFHRMNVGDSIEVKGPAGHFEYKGRGCCVVHGNRRNVRRIGLLAGGTGITPCYQVLMAIARDAEDRTEVALLFANTTPEDVFLMKELKEFDEQHSNIRVWFTVSHGTDDWPYSTGYISANMVQDHLFLPGEGTIMAMCGPPAMCKFACIPALQRLGFKESDYFEF